MKKGIFLIFFLYFQICLGQSLENKEIWKKHPELQELLQKYWQAFQVAKVADQNTGKSLAALIKLGDVEEELENRGFDEALLEELRTQAQEAYTEMLQGRETRFSKESFHFAVDSLEKVKPETTEGVVFSLKNYARDNTSRSDGLEHFLATLGEQEKMIDPSARFAFFKVSMTFYLLAEAQNFIGQDETLTKKLNQFSGLAFSEFLISNENSGVGSTLPDLQKRILNPLVTTFFASGIPNLRPVAQSLIDHYRTIKVEPSVGSFFGNLSLALKNRKHNFHLISVMAPLLTAGVATLITYYGVSGPEGWQALRQGSNLFPVLFIWGMAIHFFKKDVLGFGFRDFMRSYIHATKRSLRLQSNQESLVQSLQKTCRIAVQ